MNGTNGGIVPNNLTRVKNLNFTELGFLTYMISLDNRFSRGGKSDFFISRNDMCKECGCSSPTTITNLINKLEEKRYIKRIRLGKKMNNHYSINWDLINRIAKLKLEIGETINTDKLFPDMITEQKLVEAPKKNEVSNCTEEVKEEELAPKECEMAVCERTLENHPDEDEELIDIMFNIVDSEDPDGLIQEFCNGHKESAELMQHYYNLYKQDKVSELDAPENGNVSELDFDEKMSELFNWYIRKKRPLGFEIMYEGLDGQTTVQDIYSYDEVRDLFKEYTEMVQVA